MTQIKVATADITERPCDLLILKHADGFYGVDETVGGLIGFRKSIPQGAFRVVSGKGTGAASVMFFGVGPLAEFRYKEIREFGIQALGRAAEYAYETHRKFRKICMPIHGPGYGLDESEAFASLVAGIVEAASSPKFSRLECELIELVERNPQRARRLKDMLGNLLKGASHIGDRWESDRNVNFLSEDVQGQLSRYGIDSDSKTRLFVAMPFSDDFADEWEIAIQEAAHFCKILCERIDKTAFVGDIVTEIKRRIDEYDGLIAVLNTANPNVFLELGFAWAKEKPTVLLAKAGQDLPFDVKGQRCILYKNIADLRNKLKSELGQLVAAGAFSRTSSRLRR
jgi:hypothetical protein